MLQPDFDAAHRTNATTRHMAFGKQHAPSEAVKLVRHEFGPEGAAYVRSYLNHNEGFGKRLGALVGRRAIESGRSWALVPADSPIDRRLSFETGLFPPSGPPEPVERGFLVPSFDPSANPQLLAALGELIARPNARSALVCVEQAYGRRSDFGPDPEQWAHRVFFCGDEVYEYATGHTPPAELMRLLGGASWRPDIGLVTTPPSGLEQIRPGLAVSVDELEEIAARAVAVIVGAWDHESVLVWEPDPT